MLAFDGVEFGAFGSMSRYFVRHILRFVLLMLAVGLVVFALVSASPIDPVQANVGQAAYVNMSEVKRAQLASYWGGDVPFWERFANWAGALLHGDMGTSLRFNAPVSEVIANRAANSLALMGIAWAISGVLGFALGVVAGARRGGAVDRVVRGYCFLLASTPTFWLGLLILMIFAVRLGWFPIGFSVPIGMSAADVTLADAAHHLVLPALTLSVTGVANIALHTREKVVDVLESDYVRFVRVVRAEVLQCRQSKFVEVARKLGQSPARIALRHMVPYVLPQFVVGLILLFPHAILHEASITFLGFGLPPEQPAIGVILSESMSYLSTGAWWLAVFPGVALMCTVGLFDLAGQNLRKLIDPHTAQK